MIVVNFYPFQRIVTSTKNPKKIIENIDIGGPTMVRAAAKNFKNVTIITNVGDYDTLIKELKTLKGKTSLKFREFMSSKAFGLTAYYDSMIANWFNKNSKLSFQKERQSLEENYKNLDTEKIHIKKALFI